MSAMVVHHFGQLAGVPTPLIDAFATIAGTMVGQDFFSTGTTLADIGLDGVSAAEIRTVLERGW